MPVVEAALSTGNTAAQNGAAITSASASAGPGGGVTLPTGTFDCTGGLIDRRVTLSAPTTTLRHPDGQSAGHVLASRNSSATTATTTASSTAVTVASADGIAVGDLLAINGAGATYDTVDLAHISYIVAISGTTLTLLDPAVKSVVDAATVAGHGGFTIEGLTIDGRRGADSANNPHPLNLVLASNATIDTVTAHSGDHAGIFLQASWDCYITDCTSWDCGQPAGALGAGLWLFRDCRRNTIKNYTATGDCFMGIFIDDRTQSVGQYDGSGISNTISNSTFALDAYDYPNSACVAIVGGNYNAIEGGAMSGARYGALIAPGPQGTPRGNVGSRVVGVGITGAAIGVGVFSGSTACTIDANEFTDCLTNIRDAGTGTITGTNTAEARAARSARITAAWSTTY